MRAIVANGLLEQVRHLSHEEMRLSDPNVWDGNLAAEFRTQVWPQTKAALDQTMGALEELRSRIETINLNIMAAGGNG
jgi:hypothetical protein